MRAAIFRLLLAALALTVALSFAAGQGAVPHGRYLSPAVPVSVTDVSFPTAGPVTAAVSLFATVAADGRVSDTKVVDSAGSPTLVGYEEDSIKAARRWTFVPARYLGKPVRSTTNVALVYLPFIKRR